MKSLRTLSGFKLKGAMALTGFAAFILMIAANPIVAKAAEEGEEAAKAVPAWMCIPFACLLLCIAIFPLVKPEWWEKNRPWAVLLWSVLFIVPFAVKFGAMSAAETVLECIVGDYITFIVLLFGLFCVAGNIRVKGSLVGSPRVNVLLLTIGTLLSSWIGTTGASMLLVRPIIKMNSWRKNKAHIMVFFIFLVSNMGGSLTPIGDPPLLMGFSRGVPFFWSLKIFPILIFNMVLMLILFYCIDRRMYRKDIAKGYMPEILEGEPLVSFEGLHNLVFVAMIIVAVILSGVLPETGFTLLGEVKVKFSAILEVVIILVAAFLSFKTTNAEIRKKNHFTWGAIEEVAVLFIGIFITMQPALMILKELGPKLGLTNPYQMFWVTGGLSSFLDNTPTYLVFLTTAGSMGYTEGISTVLGIVPAKMLLAISCGAVFMGAITYIGNAPNFMVKSISDENGIKMPSFFGYIVWSLCCLVPVFLIDTLLFFL